MYSTEDVDELARLLRLTRDLGVNLAGIEVILKMRRRMIEMQKQIRIWSPTSVRRAARQRVRVGPKSRARLSFARQPASSSPSICSSSKGEIWLASVTRTS